MLQTCNKNQKKKAKQKMSAPRPSYLNLTGRASIVPPTPPRPPPRERRRRVPPTPPLPRVRAHPLESSSAPWPSCVELDRGLQLSFASVALLKARTFTLLDELMNCEIQFLPTFIVSIGIVRTSIKVTACTCTFVSSRRSHLTLLCHACLAGF